MVDFQSELITALGKEDFDSSALSILGHVNDHLFLLVRAERHLEFDLICGKQIRLHPSADVPTVT